MTTPTQFSSETTSGIASLAKQISVAEGLDQEIQAELRGHIEDKVRGYVRGEVKVSERDALILAKVHFGEAGVIKGMFQDLHSKEYGVSLVRRLVAVFAVSVWVWTIRTNVDLLWDEWFDFGTKGEKSNHIPISRLPDVVVRFVLILASIAFLWRVLAFWKARADRGRRLWFEIWRPTTLSLIVAGSILCSMSLSNFNFVQFHVFIENVDHRAVFQPSIIWAIMTGWIFPSSFFMAMGLLWIWWCDHSPRRWQTLVASGTAWLIAYQILLTVSFSTGYDVFIRDLTIRHFLLIFSDFVRPFLLMNLAFNVPLLLATVGGYVYYTRRRTVLTG